MLRKQLRRPAVQFLLAIVIGIFVTLGVTAYFGPVAGFTCAIISALLNCYILFSMGFLLFEPEDGA
ncbi:hypothetical protein EBR66_03585 [bacterium]|nr:hypothetical protein [bacterium]